MQRVMLQQYIYDNILLSTLVLFLAARQQAVYTL